MRLQPSVISPKVCQSQFIWQNTDKEWPFISWLKRWGFLADLL